MLRLRLAVLVALSALSACFHPAPAQMSKSQAYVLSGANGGQFR